MNTNQNKEFKGLFKANKKWYAKEGREYKAIKPKYAVFEEDRNGDYIFATNRNKKFKLKEMEEKDYYKFKKQYEDTNLNFTYYKNNNYYTYKNYWNKTDIPPKLRTFYLDIETIDLNNKSFPRPELAEAPITHIQILDSETNDIFILTLQNPSKEFLEEHKEAKFIEFKDEKVLIDSFIKIIHKKKPDVITAYNGNYFDFPYLVMRALKLGLDVNEFSPLNEVKFNAEVKIGDEYQKFYNINNFKAFIELTDKNKFKMEKWKIDFIGLYLLDYLELYKKFTYGDLPTYSLEYVTKYELKEGEGKVSYKDYNSIFEFYEKDYDGFCYYSIVDVLTLQKLEKKKNLIGLTGLMAHQMGCNVDLILGTIQPWATYLTNIMLDEKICPPKDISQKLDKPILGGFVKPPQVGIHKWEESIDYNSLYPSIMDAFNMCSTTYIPYEELPDEAKELYNEFRDENELKLLEDEKIYNKMKEVTEKHNIIFAGNAFFTKDKRGIVAEIVAKIYYGRKEEKQKMLFANAILKNKPNDKSRSLTVEEIIKMIDDNEINWDNVYEIVVGDIENKGQLENYSSLKELIQMAMKIQINSLYGAISSPLFVFFNRDVAASITFMGRYLIQRTSMNVNERLNEMFGKDNYIIYNDTDSCEYNTKIQVKNLSKVEYEDGTFEYLTKEEIDKLAS